MGNWTGIVSHSLVLRNKTFRKGAATPGTGKGLSDVFELIPRPVVGELVRPQNVFCTKLFSFFAITGRGTRTRMVRKFHYGFPKEDFVREGGDEGSSERSREKRKEIENRRRTGILIPERREEDGALKKLPDRRPRDRLLTGL